MLKRIKQRKERKIKRVRKNLFGTPERPRLTVFKSLNHIYAQIIDDTQGKTLAAASTLSKEIVDELANAKTNIEKSKIVGNLCAKVALENKIEKVVFDRGINKYHGRVKAIADGAREGGLKF
ncbi:MAG: 50S ribosomal protein L18 [Bacteroidetes bacterium]|nr:50S ribosomal protein L18 [Bacteroidota bacterium]MBU1116067.1 50S ribosomal protein L18 [Bacteroidota bacterium]MBU1799165.1 50S ribosomal protein L18 [Bacteroidota bacterium]